MKKQPTYEERIAKTVENINRVLWEYQMCEFSAKEKVALKEVVTQHTLSLIDSAIERIRTELRGLQKCVQTQSVQGCVFQLKKELTHLKELKESLAK